MKFRILLGLLSLIALAGSAAADDIFPISCETLHNNGEGGMCKCPANTYMVETTFRMNYHNASKMHMNLGCTALCNIKPGGEAELGTEVVWANTGEGKSTGCGQNNLMTGFWFVNQGERFKFRPLCLPVGGVTSEEESGNESDTHDYGDSGTTSCPKGSLGKGMYGRYNGGDVFHFQLQCWQEQ